MDVAASPGPAAHRRRSGVHPSGCISAHTDGRQLLCHPPATDVRCSPALHMHVQPRQNRTKPPPVTYACMSSCLAGEGLPEGHRPVRRRLAAAGAGHAALVAELLQRGAAADLRTRRGSLTALRLAAGRGHAAAVEQLLQHGGGPAALGGDGQLALNEAVSKGHNSD